MPCFKGIDVLKCTADLEVETNFYFKDNGTAICQGGGGYPYPSRLGDTPILPDRGTPSVLMGGTMGYPIRTGWGYPLSGLDGVPPIGTGWGYAIGTQWGYPPPPSGDRAA